MDIMVVIDYRTCIEIGDYNMDEAKKKICDEAYRYITNDLGKWLDDEIFTKTTFEELGKLYYTHTMVAVENLTVELLVARCCYTNGWSKRFTV